MMSRLSNSREISQNGYIVVKKGKKVFHKIIYTGYNVNERKFAMSDNSSGREKRSRQDVRERKQAFFLLFEQIFQNDNMESLSFRMPRMREMLR